MKCYLVQAPGAKRYAGTQADAKAKRDDLMTLTNSKKKDVSIEDAEIPADKGGQLDFINSLCKELDDVKQDAQ